MKNIKKSHIAFIISAILLFSLLFAAVASGEESYTYTLLSSELRDSTSWTSNTSAVRSYTALYGDKRVSSIAWLLGENYLANDEPLTVTAPEYLINCSDFDTLSLQMKIWKAYDPVIRLKVGYSEDSGKTVKYIDKIFSAVPTGEAYHVPGFTAGAVYTIDTGDILSHIKADKITNIVLRPFGDEYYRFGGFRMMNFEITATSSKKMDITTARPDINNDTQTIQKMIDDAKAAGKNEITIPSLNPRTNSNIWYVGDTILLPDDITVYIDNCTLRLADNVFCNIFANETAWNEKLTIEEEQKSIKIIGIGDAVLDGGTHNGLTEKTSNTNGYPTIYKNLLVFFRNVDGFEIKNLTFKDNRWWGMCFDFCRNGNVEKIHFECRNNVPNQDGIDLRIGCNNITISEITGDTGDDTIALTALHGTDYTRFNVEGKDTDIHDVTISNVKARCVGGHGIIRLLNHDGSKLYNVSISDVYDTHIDHKGAACAAGIRIGEATRYAQKRVMEKGELYNVTVKNVKSCAKYTILINNPNIYPEHYTLENIENTNGNVISGYNLKK